MNVHLKSDTFETDGIAYPCAVWRRFIAATVDYIKANDAKDEAEFAAMREVDDSLTAPWFPNIDGPWDAEAVVNTNDHLVVEGKRGANVRLEDGCWAVLEYQPSSYRAQHSEGLSFPSDYDAIGQRWMTYPDALDGNDALKLSERRARKEWRSFKARMAAISRKHRVKPLNQESWRLHDLTVELAREISDTKDSSTAMAAVRLGAYMIGESISAEGRSDSGFALNDCECDGLSAVYRDLVAKSGFDPIAEWKAEPGLN